MLTKLNQIIINLAELEQNFVAVERTRQYFDNPLEDIKNIPSVNAINNGERLVDMEAANDPQDAAIVFDKVFMSYNCNDEEKEISYALKNVSFCIKKGEKVAFCGRF